MRSWLIISAGLFFTLSASVVAETNRADTTDEIFPQAYFSTFQPRTALDMVQHIPGFTIRTGNNDLRGYSGAAGNVLIDGQRPTSKEKDIEELLDRIPASSVDYIQIMREGDVTFDMQNYALLANIVRKQSSTVSGQIRVENTVHATGDLTPSISGDFSLNSGEHSIDITGILAKEIDDTKGRGSRNRYSQGGHPLRLANYSEPEHDTVKELSAKYRRPLWGGSVRLNAFLQDENEISDTRNDIFFPLASQSTSFEKDKTHTLELGVNYDRSLGHEQQIEFIGLHRSTKTNASEESIDMDTTANTLESSKASETILRGVFRQKIAAATIESGTEATFNTFNSDTTLEENGSIVPLPASSAHISENRVELFTTASVQFTPSIAFDAGIYYETSVLRQQGANATSKKLNFLKPRALIRWEASKKNEVRFLVERKVGQLDFEDFISTTSLSEDSTVAGNKDLEPEKTWRLQVTWEHQHKDASLALIYRHDIISDVVDHIPLSAGEDVFDSVGNITSGKRDEIEVNLNLPLKYFGLERFILQANTKFRQSRVTDPVTNSNRSISTNVPLEGEILLTYDLPALNMLWGSEYTFAEKEVSYEFDEVQHKTEPERLNFFIEYKPASRWSFRAFVNNITNSPEVTRRTIYDGFRSINPVDYLDTKTLRGGRSFGVSIERTFP